MTALGCGFVLSRQKDERSLLSNARPLCGEGRQGVQMAGTHGGHGGTQISCRQQSGKVSWRK